MDLCNFYHNHEPSSTIKDVGKDFESKAYIIIQMPSGQNNWWRLISFIEVFQSAAILGDSDNTS